MKDQKRKHYVEVSQIDKLLAGTNRQGQSVSIGERRRRRMLRRKEELLQPSPPVKPRESSNEEAPRHRSSDGRASAS